MLFLFGMRAHTAAHRYEETLPRLSAGIRLACTACAAAAEYFVRHDGRSRGACDQRLREQDQRHAEHGSHRARRDDLPKLLRGEFDLHAKSRRDSNGKVQP